MPEKITIQRENGSRVTVTEDEFFRAMAAWVQQKGYAIYNFNIGNEPVLRLTPVRKNLEKFNL